MLQSSQLNNFHNNPVMDHHHHPHNQHHQQYTNDLDFFNEASHPQHSGQQHHQQNGNSQQYVDGYACERCTEGFGLDEQIVNSGGQVWHAECFV